ncbi:BQ2448_5211 [Microbotryum intermedium]|uniref:BQ2448_5206 protein n=1 Tax=Microbotryum intermedium TaxID=269621 RepID=A0A238F0E3_9BASI|nr:BQ2448_5206 [Microbotryum intermedium]SCV67600.1 BQ2448_5211 [Microbotryum intermedium]
MNNLVGGEISVRAAQNPDKLRQDQQHGQSVKTIKEARDLLERVRRGRFPCPIYKTSGQNHLSVGVIVGHKLYFGKARACVDFPEGGTATLDFALDPSSEEGWTATFTVHASPADQLADRDPRVYVCRSGPEQCFIASGTLESTLPTDPDLWKINALDSGNHLNAMLRLDATEDPLSVEVPAARATRRRRAPADAAGAPKPAQAQPKPAVINASASTPRRPTNRAAPTTRNASATKSSLVPMRTIILDDSDDNLVPTPTIILDDSDDEVEFLPPKNKKRLRKHELS